MNRPMVPPGVDDPSYRSALRLAIHLRAYLPLYVMAAGFVLVAALLPTVNRTSSSAAGSFGAAAAGEQVAAGATPGAGGAATGGGASTSGALGGSAGTVGAAGGGGAAGGSGAAGAAGAAGGATPGAGGGPAAPAAVGKPQVGTGTTRGGTPCTPSTRQLAWTQYAAPCVAAYSGSNGGATSRGVTADQIVLARRTFASSPNQQAVEAFAEEAGSAPQSTIDAVRQVFLDYFNKTYELYGRKLVIKDVDATGDSTMEAEGQGQQAACADADNIANSVKAFGESGEPDDGAAGGSAPFSQCAARYKLVEFAGAAYYDETFYKSTDPYVYNVLMECQRISHQVAEYMGKRLFGKPAKFAGDPVTQSKIRKFGTYVPNNDAYQRCVDVFQNDLRSQYHVDPGDRYNYVLDVSRFPDQASQAVVQFHANGDTTIVLACDPISPIFMTEEARGQNYYPEWFILGVAAQDADTVPRLWDGQEVTGRLFGMSQLSAIQNIWGPTSEAGITYKKITGKDIPAGTNGDYASLVMIFNMLQAAGPILTPQTLAQGARTLGTMGVPLPGSQPVASPVSSYGNWSFTSNPDGSTPGFSHTLVIDSREVYWDADCTSPYDGKQGCYQQTMDGKRFTNGQWPTGDPPIYPPNDKQ